MLATPAGSSVNILGIHLIEETVNVHVSFVEWMAIGIPMVLVLVPVACCAILWSFPPEVKTVGDVAELSQERLALGPITLAEKKTITLLGTMMVLWIAGSWIEFFDVLIVALCGAIVMFSARRTVADLEAGRSLHRLGHTVNDWWGNFPWQCVASGRTR